MEKIQATNWKRIQKQEDDEKKERLGSLETEEAIHKYWKEIYNKRESTIRST